MFGLITTKRHLQILADERAVAADRLNEALAKSRVKGRIAAEALFELSKHKASRARSNANLRPGNVRRKLDAQTT